MSSRPGSSSVFAPNTPKKRVQKSATPSAFLLAGTSAFKRKASTSLRGISSSSQKNFKTSNAPRRRPKKEAVLRDHRGKVLSEKDYESQPYVVECPAKQAKRNETTRDVFRGSDAAALGLEVEYAIRPGHWGEMRSYRSAKYEDIEFKKGDFAYFAKNLTPSEDITEEEILASHDPLAFERETFYLGMIADIRADNAHEVYMRILYAYWPEELPHGRQSHHGMKEVIMSNHMDIKEAHTIGSKVEVCAIDESMENVSGIYWRQTLDISRFASRRRGVKPGVLSLLRTHCRCDQPSNPDKPMYACRDPTCDTWQHEACLIDAALDMVEMRFQSVVGLRNGGPEDAENSAVVVSQTDEPAAAAAESTLTSAVFGNEGTIFQDSQPGSPLAEQMVGTVPERTEYQGMQRVKPDHYDGVYSVSIDTKGKYGKEGVVMARVTEAGSGRIVLTVAMNCFGCGKTLE